MRIAPARAACTLASALAACALAGGCGSSASEPLRNAGSDTHATPASPPPRIAWRDGQFDTGSLPAVGTRGDVVVVPFIENDGGRGFANLRIDVLDASDHVTRRIDVMGTDEYEAFVPDGQHAAPALDARITAANDALASLATEHALVPMQRRAKPDLTVDFAAHGWLAPQGQRCPGCPPCENPPYLDAVYDSPHARFVLVRVAYRGTDTCWEPSSQWHVLPR
jgi:hypothetical protein